MRAFAVPRGGRRSRLSFAPLPTQSPVSNATDASGSGFASCASAGAAMATSSEIVAVTRAIPVFEFGRPLRGGRLDEAARLIEAHLAAAARLEEPACLRTG